MVGRAWRIEPGRPVSSWSGARDRRGGTCRARGLAAAARRAGGDRAYGRRPGSGPRCTGRCSPAPSSATLRPNGFVPVSRSHDQRVRRHHRRGRRRRHRRRAEARGPRTSEAILSTSAASGSIRATATRGSASPRHRASRSIAATRHGRRHTRASPRTRTTRRRRGRRTASGRSGSARSRRAATGPAMPSRPAAPGTLMCGPSPAS